jgi:hypothetical protein
MADEIRETEVVREERPVVVERDRGSNAGVIIAVIVVLVILALLFGGRFFGGDNGSGTGGDTNIEVQTPATDTTTQ